MGRARYKPKHESASATPKDVADEHENKQLTPWLAPVQDALGIADFGAMGYLAHTGV
jgi:hypothetical protein